jgi:hypothetical protein
VITAALTFNCGAMEELSVGFVDKGGTYQILLLKF